MRLPVAPDAIPLQRTGGRDPAPTETGAQEFDGLMHDLGHGLSTLSLLLDAVRSERPPEALSRRLDLAAREATRLLGLLHSAGSGDPADEPIPVRATLDHIATLATSSRSTSVTVAPGPDVRLRVGSVLLARVVGNLVDNAVRAAGSDGSVQLTLSSVGGTTVIEVVDDGPGFRGTPGPTHLGLVIVRRLLQSCGGRLEIHEVAPRGTRMRVVFLDLPMGAGRHVS